MEVLNVPVNQIYWPKYVKSCGNLVSMRAKRLSGLRIFSLGNYTLKCCCRFFPKFMFITLIVEFLYPFHRVSVNIRHDHGSGVLIRTNGLSNAVH